MKNITNLFLIFLTISLYSQRKIDSLYGKYFEANREITYLHLNKTSIVKGENLWFKTYVINQKSGKLSDFTRNLYCLIYDEEGKLKTKKLLYVEDGVASGYFEIDSSFTRKNYFIKTGTNWMKNFKEDNSFAQKINVLDSKNFNETKSPEVKNYEIQFLPEEGNAIGNISNNYGIIIKNQNNIGINITKGEILDDKRQLIQTFSTNQFGLGKVSFYQKPNTTYISKITFNDGTTAEKVIPTALNKGIALQVENNISPILKVTIATNKETLESVLTKNFTLFIHNTNTTITKNLRFSDKETAINILLPKNKLSAGVNIITLLDEFNIPIAERLLFNNSNNLLSDIAISASVYDKDSLVISLTKNSQMNDITYLSASILPKNTMSYTPDNNIVSELLLKPFVKGDIQNPKYYFTNINNTKLAELDVLLQTQGWSKYAWNNIFNNTPNYTFESENGISLKGKLNSNKINDSTEIYLVSPENSLLEKIALNKKSFSYSNLYLKDNSNVKFIAINKRKMLKTRGVIYENKNLKTPKKIELNTSFNKATKQKENLAKNIFDEATELNPISVKTKVRKPKNRPFYFNSSLNRTVILIDENYKGTQDIGNFLRQLNFYVRNTNNTLNSGIIITRSAYRPFNNSVAVYLNNFLISDKINDYSPIGDNANNAMGFGNLDVLTALTVSDFSEIHFGNREIYFYLNYNKKRKSYKSHKFLNYQLPLGFASEKKFYNPKYNIKSKSYEKYGAIHWQPNIKIGSNENSTSFKVPSLSQEKIIIYLEGITSSGKLISTSKEITVKASEAY